MSALGDVIAAAAGRVADETIGAIDGLVHQAAVDLLNGLLPPMVHGQNAAIRAGAWMGIAAEAGGVAAGIQAASATNGALQGMVAKKVEQGLRHLSRDTDYARAVNSIG